MKFALFLAPHSEQIPNRWFRKTILSFLLVCSLFVNNSFAQNLQGLLLTGINNCPGADLQVAYQASGSFLPGNQFRLQLSDNNGSFVTPTNLAVASQLSGIFNSSFPTQALPSNNYKLRIISTNPVVSFLFTDTFTLYEKAGFLVQPIGGNFCTNSQVILSALGTEGSQSYQWFKDGLPITGANQSSLALSQVNSSDNGFYFVQINGCGIASSDTVSVQITANNAISFQESPFSTFFCANDSVVLNFKATGNSPNWQWLRNGIPILGATDTFLIIPSFSAINAGTYTIRGLNVCGLVFSDTFSLSLAQPLQITGLPTNLSACLGDSVRFSLETLGQPALQFDWYKQQQFIATTTLPYLAIPALTFADSGVYSVEVIGLCDTLQSNLVVVSILDTVSILNSPTNVEVCEGDSISFRISILGNFNNITWQRAFDSTIVATDSLFTISQISLLDSGWYFATISGFCQQLVIDSFFIRVIPSTKIISQPLDSVYCIGSQVILKPKVSGSQVTTIWQLPGLGQSVIADSIIIAAFTATDTGLYQFQVVGACGTAQGLSFNLQLYATPNISNLNDTVFCEFASASMFIPINLSNTDSLIWLKNTDSTIFSFGNTLNWPTFTLEDTGYYQPIVKSLCGIDTLQGFKVGIIEAPRFATMFKDTFVCLNASIDLLPIVSDTTNFAFQWFFNNLPIVGATNSTLSINTFSNNDIGNYFVRLANSCNVYFSDTIILDTLGAIRLQNFPDTIYACVGSAFELRALGAFLEQSTISWYKDGSFLTTTFGNILPFDTLQINNGGSYQAMATSPCGQVLVSNSFVLLVSPTPVWTVQPTVDSLWLCEGEPFELAASVQTNTATTFGWFQLLSNGTEILRSSNDTLQLNLSLTDSGIYYAKASNGFCEIISEPTNLNVWQRSSISFQSTFAQICYGNTDFIQVMAVGDSLQFQWYRNNQPIVGATSSILTFTNFSPADEGVYYCFVSGVCNAITSNNIPVSKPNAIQLSSPINDTTICVGSALLFNISSNQPPLLTKWFFNNAPFVSFNGLTVDLQNVTQANAGNYKVVVDGQCSVDSFEFQLTINDPFSFSGFIGVDSACLGQPLQIEALIAAGSTPFEATWFKNGFSIANGTILNINSLSVADTGIYELEVSDYCGTQTITKTIKAFTPTEIELTTSANNFCFGSSFELSANTFNSGIGFVFTYNGQFIGQQTLPIFQFPAKNNIQSGVFMVGQLGVCSNSPVDTVWSDALQIEVLPQPNAPEINRLPNGLLSINVNDNFRWFRNGQLLPSEERIIAPLQVGIYNTVVVDANGCLSDTSNSIIQPFAFIVDEHPFDNLIVQNELLNGALNLHFLLRQQAVVAFEVFNISGQKVKEGTLHIGLGQQTVNLKLESHQSGLYLLRLSANNRTSTIKWLHSYQPK